MQRLVIPLVVGVASVAVGSWLLASRYHDLDYQLQGKCDYMPCVTAADLPTLIALTGLLVLGFFLLGVAAAGAFWRPHQRKVVRLDSNRQSRRTQTAAVDNGDDGGGDDNAPESRRF